MPDIPEPSSGAGLEMTDDPELHQQVCTQESLLQPGLLQPGLLQPGLLQSGLVHCHLAIYDVISQCVHEFSSQKIRRQRGSLMKMQKDVKYQNIFLRKFCIFYSLFLTPSK